MSIRAMIVIVLAATCGVSAAVGVNQFRKPARAGAQPETTAIVVAAVDIPRGRMVSKDDVKICQWPKGLLPKTAVQSVKAAVKRAALTPIVAGEPLLQAKLASKGAGHGLASLIPSGMRAYTIMASKVAANVAGFILPGNRVDVLLNLRGKQNDETGGGSTTTLLQAVEILAVDQRLDAPSDNKVDPINLRSVTLLVTPDQAAMLDLGQNMGHLTLSLRNPQDNDEAKTQPALLADIRFHQEKPAAEPTPDSSDTVVIKQEQQRETFSIMTLRGSQRGQMQIGVRGG